MTKITETPFITPSSNTSFVVTDYSTTARVPYNDLLAILSNNLQGVQGSQGSSTGDTGAQGIQGIQGGRGTQGITGRAIQGSQGTSGSAVAQGAQGPAGSGAQGAIGSGTQGIQGRQGLSGSAVAQGAQGITGNQGVQGIAGTLITTGATTQVIYNDGGTLTGDAVLTWDKSSKTLTIGQNSTNGSTLIKGYYSNGALTVFGTEYSSGGPMLGYAVTPSTAAVDAFLSATNSGPLSRGAYTIAGMTHKWFAGASQTVAAGSAATLTKMMYLDNTGLTINGNLTVTGTLANTIPSGGIIMWAGVSIPSGWYLCDGSNGTPDLRDRFVVGTGSTYSVGNTGGSADATLPSHSHTFTGNALGSHYHTTQYSTGGGGGAYYKLNGSGGYEVNQIVTDGASAGTPSGTIGSTGASPTNANLPPYYALAFIMKA